MTKHERKPAEQRMAYFISPHGFGHAARAAAVMTAIHAFDPAIRFEIFTRVPRWFFEDSLRGPWGYHSLLTDIGLAQHTSLAEDLPETLRRLDRFLPLDVSQIGGVAGQLNQLGCRLVVCDIAPMGIAVAREAGLPSVLVENFTWDWIYQGYLEQAPRLSRHIPYLRELFAAADYHVQTEPVCRSDRADLTAPPISRKSRTPARQIRQQLGIPAQARVVTLTMGGIPWQYNFLEHLSTHAGVYFVIPGAGQRAQVRDNLALLPHHSNYFHPDLMNASDAVVGKLGYSTLAELYYAGVPFGYIPRPGFRESPVLSSYVEREMKGLAITPTQFQNGGWAVSIEQLLALPRIQRRDCCGADQVARFIHSLL